MSRPPRDEESCIAIASRPRGYCLGYTSGEELLPLIETLCTTAVELSIGVRPKASPEFWELRRKAKKEWNERRYLGAVVHGTVDQFLDQDENGRSLQELANELKIMPFNVQHYRFSPGYGSNLLRINSEFLVGRSSPEIQETMRLIQGWRLCFVSLRDALEREHMDAMKQWVVRMHEQGYEPSWVRAKLNPADWYDSDLVRYNAAEIVARQGTVTAIGIRLEREPVCLEDLIELIR